MRPYCFPMTAGNNSQTILLPTAKYLLDLTNLTVAEKEKAHLHPAVFANAEVMVSMGSILYKDNVCFTSTILFGRIWNQEVPIQPPLGAAIVNNNLCSSMNVTNQTELQYETAFRDMFHFDGKIYGCTRKTLKNCYSITYKQTGGVTTGQVVATLPAVIFHSGILGTDHIRTQVNYAYTNHSFT